MIDRGKVGWRSVYRQGSVTTFIQLALALALALMIAPTVRTIAIEINRSAERVWPFSIEHCRIRATPGCDPQKETLADGLAIANGQTGR